MTKLISEEYRAQLIELHSSPRGIGAGGAANAGEIIAVSMTNGLRRVLDYGAGQGKLKEALRDYGHFTVYNYDPAVTEYMYVPPAVERDLDLITCTDVLEHVEPDCLGAVLKHLRSLRPKWWFFVIALQPSSKDLPDGRNAHLSVHEAWWWADMLRPFGETISWFLRRSRSEPYTAIEIHVWIKRKGE